MPLYRYQESDWRLRPLPDAMIRYARGDTHYLLYIHDQMSLRLLSSPMGREDLLLVYEESYDICMKLYETKLFTNTSYLYMKGLREADFDSQQLSIAAALCEWRDFVARAEDESTGYIMSNKTLLKIAKQKPLTLSAVTQYVKPSRSHTVVDPDILFEIIQSSLQNASAFESAAQLLRTQQRPDDGTDNGQTQLKTGDGIVKGPRQRRTADGTVKGPNKMTVIWREAQKTTEDRNTPSPQQRTSDGTVNLLNKLKTIWREAVGKYWKPCPAVKREEVGRHLTLKREIVECSRCGHLQICSRCLQVPGATKEATSEE